MERKEGRREEEIIHRVQLDAAHGGDDQHDKEEKEERDRREETDLARQWSRLKFFRHHHGDLITGNQVLVRPNQIPPAAAFVFLGRRKSVVREINIFKVRLHLQAKVAHL